MADVAFSGKRGVFTFTGLGNFNTASWTINGTTDMAEVTEMDASAEGATVHWKQYVAGFKDWTMTVELFDDTSGISGLVAVLGTSDSISLDTTEGLAYAGTAFFVGANQGTDANGAATMSLSFQGTSAMTIS